MPGGRRESALRWDANVINSITAQQKHQQLHQRVTDRFRLSKAPAYVPPKLQEANFREPNARVTGCWRGSVTGGMGLSLWHMLRFTLPASYFNLSVRGVQGRRCIINVNTRQNLLIFLIKISGYDGLLSLRTSYARRARLFSSVLAPRLRKWLKVQSDPGLAT